MSQISKSNKMNLVHQLCSSEANSKSRDRPELRMSDTRPEFLGCPDVCDTGRTAMFQLPAVAAATLTLMMINAWWGLRRHCLTDAVQAYCNKCHQLETFHLSPFRNRRRLLSTRKCSAVSLQCSSISFSIAYTNLCYAAYFVSLCNTLYHILYCVSKKVPTFILSVKS